jgi:hypothetical protein
VSFSAAVFCGGGHPALPVRWSTMLCILCFIFYRFSFSLANFQFFYQTSVDANCQGRRLVAVERHCQSPLDGDHAAVQQNLIFVLQELGIAAQRLDETSRWFKKGLHSSLAMG